VEELAMKKKNWITALIAFPIVFAAHPLALAQRA
jgi:hypothetical protein